MALEEDGERMAEYDGYVPAWFPTPKEDNGGDYVLLDIDVDTGKILNWKKPTKANLKETFKSGQDRESYTDSQDRESYK